MSSSSSRAKLLDWLDKKGFIFGRHFVYYQEVTDKRAFEQSNRRAELVAEFDDISPEEKFDRVLGLFEGMFAPSQSQYFPPQGFYDDLSLLQQFTPKNGFYFERHRSPQPLRIPYPYTGRAADRVPEVYQLCRTAFFALRVSYFDHKKIKNLLKKCLMQREFQELKGDI